MKKMLALILVLVMCLSLCACGNIRTPSNDDTIGVLAGADGEICRMKCRDVINSYVKKHFETAAYADYFYFNDTLLDNRYVYKYVEAILYDDHDKRTTGWENGYGKGRYTFVIKFDQLGRAVSCKVVNENS